MQHTLFASDTNDQQHRNGSRWRFCHDQMDERHPLARMSRKSTLGLFYASMGHVVGTVTLATETCEIEFK